MNAQACVLVYDGTCGLCRKMAHLAIRLHPRVPLQLVDAANPRDLANFPQISPYQAMQSVHLILPTGQVLRGYDAVVGLTELLPVFRFLVPLMRTRLMHRLGWALYEWVTAHRHRISRVLFLK
jgi:predicted DCC family thiol-disulfide oxidoreductase YuxK